jgi:steroid 5-alpha reductase family enzyme
MSTGLLLIEGAIAVTLVMTALWVLGRIQRNFSYVDIGWSANFALLAVIYGILGAGSPLRRGVIGAMFTFWGLRLALHLSHRILGEPEEGRYQELRRRWGADGEPALNRRMYAFFMLQGALNLFLSIPLLVAVQNPTPGLSPWEWAGFLIWAVGLGGEWLSDLQLSLFKANPGNRGKVCDQGLWRYSRHPNYFFEWTIWVAYACFALGSPPWGYLGLLMPPLMLHFLLNVTGIRATEEQALRSKGDAYRDYQRRTSAFVPLPPKR